MAIEIERKFLVQSDAWRSLGVGKYYCQGYLHADAHISIRVRIVETQGYLTIKGKIQNFSRPEFEYPIPLTDAQDMLDRWCPANRVEKKRYRIPMGDLVWEVDEFLGLNQGLVLAEVELNSPDQGFEIPDWIGEEVSSDPRYFNSMLAKHPYLSWETEQAET